MVTSLIYNSTNVNESASLQNHIIILFVSSSSNPVHFVQAVCYKIGTVSNTVPTKVLRLFYTTYVHAQ